MPPKKRSTWEVQASIPVLYTHQKVAKRPVHKEAHLRLNAGKAVLCDANGKRLDEDTVTSSLLQQLSSGEELDFPGHLLSPDPPDAAKVALSNAMAVPTRTTTTTNVSPRAGPLGASAASARGTTPSMPPVAKKKFKRPRLLEAPAPTEPEREEFHEGPEIAEPAIPPKEEVNDTQPAATPTPTPCRNELRGVKGPFKVPRPQSLWTTLQEVPEATFPGVQLPPQAFHPPEAPPAADPPDPSGDTTLELCRKALMTERRNLERNSADSLSDDEIFLSQAASAERERRARKTQAPTDVEVSTRPVDSHAEIASGQEALASGQQPMQPAPFSQQQVAALPQQCSFASVQEEALAWEQQHMQPPPISSSQQEVAALPQQCSFASVQEEALAWEQQQLHPAPFAQQEAAEQSQPAIFPEDTSTDVAEATAGMTLDGHCDGASDVSEDEEDLPLSEIIKAAFQAPRRRRSSGSRSTMISTRLPLTFGKCHVENQPLDVHLTNKAAYVEYFEQALVSEMQHRLTAWAAAPASISSLRVDGLLLGPAKDDPTLAAFIFNRSYVRQGDLARCAKNDLWVVLQGDGEALLFRSLWKGVTPKGRLLCSPVTAAAVSWLQNRQGRWRLDRVTAFCSNAFSSELVQVDTLRQWASGDDCCCHLLGLEPKAPAVAPAEPTECELPGVPLSEEQEEVVRHVATWPGQPGCLLVPGVFGSGKSRTLAKCLVLLDRLLTAQKDSRRILLLCQTNVAVDGVLQSLLQMGFDDFVRIGSFRSMHPAVLHKAAGNVSTRKAMTKELTDVLKHLEEVSPEMREKLQALLAMVKAGELPPRSSLWRKRRLVATTSAALEAVDLGARFHAAFVFVDEASQLTETSIVYAFRKVSAESALLLGDPKQLPPRATHPPLQRSALVRLATCHPTLELRTQYRCHPLIGHLCGQLFYEGLLRNGVTEEERSSVLGHGVAPLAVVLSQGLETRVGHSYRHDAEAKLCVEWLRRAQQRSQVKAEDFGVISLYRSHADACATAAEAGGITLTNVATVDAFQGGEREAVALCCGRSSPDHGDGTFTCCPKRLNVALSRARRHLVIFGSETFLSTHPIFSRILHQAAMSGCVYRASDVLQ